MAESFGFCYIHRPDWPAGKKAGNLRYAFSQTSAEYLVVLDADFAPRRDFLAETLPYMDNPAIAIVQTPQYFRTSPEQTWIERAAGPIQEVFYRVVQVARNRLDAAVCCGTSAVYRRAALEPQGGPTLIPYAEDVHTGLDVRRAGWSLTYVPILLSTGICPDRLDAFVRQQYRWCSGNVGIVFSRRLWSVPMRIPARLTYISGFLYYVYTALLTFFGPIIPIVMLAFLPGQIRLRNFIVLLPAMLTGFVLYPLWHLSGYGPGIWPLGIARGWAHVLALWDGARGKSMSWHPTRTPGSSLRRFRLGVTWWSGGVAAAVAGSGPLANDHPRFPAVRGPAVLRRAQPRGGRPGDLPREPRKMTSRLVMILAIALAVASLAGASLRLTGSSVSPPPAAHASLPPSLASYLGVFEPGAPPAYDPVADFAAAVGRKPNLLGFYSGWTEPFDTSFAQTLHRNGVIPFVQIDPTDASIAAIANGTYDDYLRTYADSVRGFDHNVVIGFGHEMNAYWYSWGYRHVTPATFVAAWRHIVTLFRDEGADNVTWVWTVQADEPGTRPIASWWPGAQYVTWVGIDGYYYGPTDTFRSVFGQTIDQVQAFTSRPVLLSETAVGPDAGPIVKIQDLFQGMAAYKTLGLVWFDVAQHGGRDRQDWRIEDNPLAEISFKLGVARELAPSAPAD